MNEITQKLTRAHIQRCKVQAEKYSKAKINTIKSFQVKVNRKTMERDNTWSSVKIDRKLDNAIKNRCEVVSEKQNKAKIHNQRVLERINFVSSEFDKKLDSLQELTQSKLKNAASLRGSQLLQVRQTAEKLRNGRYSLEGSVPVAFEIKIEESASNASEVPAIKKRLEERQKSLITIEDISEKLTRAKTRRNMQRE